MEYENERNFAEPEIKNTKPKKSRWRIFWSIFTGFSVVFNVLLFIAIIGMAGLLAFGQEGLFTEKVIRKGPKTDKIAVININGIIDGKAAADTIAQLKKAKEDPKLRAVILSVNSPGGMVSSSDQIHNAVEKYKTETNQPVISFMNSVAASGGYYVSVPCDAIIAEPTAITGSIGVIIGYFVIGDLLEGKLGVQPVIIKSGEKKDWPSSFTLPTDEQRQYLMDKLIDPSYQRFVNLVAKGRSIDIEKIKPLADGSIYTADQALENDLIDQIGYLDDAIAMAKELANISDAAVVEYTKPFSAVDLLRSQSKAITNLDRTTLYELTSPNVMYLWHLY